MPENTMAKDVEITVEVAPQLWGIQFERSAASQEGEQPFPIDLGFGLTRFAKDVFGIELTVSAKDGAPASIKVSYRAVFRIHLQSQADTSDYDAVVRDVLLYTGPSVIYPYIRETVASLFQKSGLQTVTLPLVNFYQIVDPSRVEIPPPPPQPHEPTD